MTRIFIVLALCVVASLLIVPTAAAQDNATADDLPDGLEDDDRHVQVDRYVEIEDWEYNDGRYSVTLNATRQDVRVGLMPPLGSADEDGGNLEARTVDLEHGEPRTTTVEADGDLTIMSEHFIDTGEYAALDRGTQSIIGGPYGPEDIWIAAGATAIGLGATVAIRVFMHLLGIGQRTERIA